LVLNASGEPHSIIEDKEAVCMLLDTTVDVIELSGEVFRSQYLTIDVPSIVQLRRYVKLPDTMRSIPLNTRNVLARDEYVCGYCGLHADTMDHIVPRALGGRHVWTNVVACCRRCNQRKGRKPLEQLGWELRHTPYKPKGSGAHLLGRHPRPEWRPYFALTKA
jgi:5-methylcytosine-specific restriction endonuclease McrA